MAHTKIVNRLFITGSINSEFLLSLVLMTFDEWDSF
jgi:hypothetical protein